MYVDKKEIDNTGAYLKNTISITDVYTHIYDDYRVSHT